jgi:exopolysaccharide biosynthesis predicted pyruvyltransferase EpsI
MIAIAEQSFLKETIPEYRVVEITNRDYLEDKMRFYLRIQESDLIVLTGGGYMDLCGLIRETMYIL